MNKNRFKENPKDLRILLIDLSKRYGGASARTLKLAEHLKPWEVAIAGIEGSQVLSLAKERNIPIWVLGKFRLDPLIPFRLRKIIQNCKYQIIDTQNIQSKFWGSLTALITRVAFVATLNSSYSEEQGSAIKSKFYSWLDLRTNLRTDRFIAVSKGILTGLVENGIPETMVDLISNAIETEESPIKECSILIRQKIGVPNDAFLILSIGRLVWAKAYEDFVDAFATVSENYSNVFAVIAGDGNQLPFLSKRILSLGLEKRFFLLGYCDPETIRALLYTSDLFVLSSRSEGVPLAILEAASVGLPIVSTNCGGIPEILSDGINALLVPVGDPPALSASILKIYKDRQFAEKIGINAREKIKQDYGIQSQIDLIRKAYLSAIKHRQHR